MLNGALRSLLMVFATIAIFMGEVEWATLFVGMNILLKLSEDK